MPHGHVVGRCLCRYFRKQDLGFWRPRSQPRPAGFGVRPSPHLMTPAAVGNRDTTAAVFNGLGRIYMVTDPPTAAETGLEPTPHRGRRSGASWQGSSNPWLVIFNGKKAPAASWIAATGLVKSWVAIFAEKKKRLRQDG